jgi:transcription-repair coupling factor (superfamily II helicase)
MTRTLPKRDFLANTRVLKIGQAVRLEKLIETWVGAGYESVTTVVEPGQFARRGGIIDIFPAADDWPARLELFGDELDTLRRFDPATQRSGETVESVTITPAREGLPKHWKEKDRDEEAGSEASLESHLEFDLPLMVPPASILEYLPDNALVLIDDWRELADTVAEFEEQAVVLCSEQIEAGVIPADFPLPYHPWADLQDELNARAPVLMARADDEQTLQVVDLGARFHPGPRYGGQLKPLLDHLRDLLASADRTVVVTRQAQRLAELWAEHHAPITPSESIGDWPAEGALAFVQGALSEGWRLDVPKEEGGRRKEVGGRMREEETPSSFILPPFSLHLLTDSEIFGWARPEVRRRAGRAAVAAPESFYSDLAVGDYVVHADFGIGRFKGLVHRAIDGLEREYLWLEYASGDELYVQIHQADRLTRYIGPDEHPPTLSRLGSADWTTAKSRARQAVEAVAKELLELYAKRETIQGRAFGPDAPWQAELEASFPYVETDDQLRALREVKADMEKHRPMDRLICGDVGYGKTEVALRAAFKAVMDGVQVAVLVPTTVLAQQHLHTFQSRLAPYPVKVEMLSRFRSHAEAEDIKAQLAEGQIDIILGTHRLLQKDVQFKNLGLLIIDEEQRFGVTHKEFLKQKRTEVDVLTLTATPIPRTLYMSLTGVRDISTINTPPAERLPVITHVGPYNERLVRQAIQRELDRDGQVFFVHNRVQTIEVIHEKLKRLAPEARIGVGHGQMDEHELSRVMDQFTEGEIDILLCTSIIESGLDIPNANTLIVDRADTFGLAQLYQLRGRVGRAAQRAYAYFLFESRHRVTPEAYQRLETIGEQTELGAGYSIAMRDLEMRGAGDLLGVRQSGQIAAVGFHLYTRLLGEAVRWLKAGSRKVQPSKPEEVLAPLTSDLGQPDLGLVTVDLPLPTSIPADYVADKSLRLRLYRRLADLHDEASLDAVSAEFAERFGPLPAPVENLLYQLRVKIKALRAGVVSVGSESGQIVLTLPPLAERENYAVGELGPGVRVSRNKIWLPRAASERDWREQVLSVLAQLEKDQRLY